MLSNTKILVEGFSNKNIRKENQDFIGSEKNKSKDYLLVLADGMGGHSEGGFCAKYVVQQLTKRFSTSNSGEWEGAKPFNWLKDTVEEIRQDMKELALSKDLNLDMGTTLVGVIISNGVGYCFNIGDSRCYIIIEDKITLMTNDQIIGNYPELRHLGHPSHLVSALGPTKQATIDFTYSDLTDKCLIVLTSDGIHGVLSNERILKVIGQSVTDLETRVKTLVKESLLMGSTDNSTCIVMEIK